MYCIRKEWDVVPECKEQCQGCSFMETHEIVSSQERINISLELAEALVNTTDSMATWELERLLIAKGHK